LLDELLRQLARLENGDRFRAAAVETYRDAGQRGETAEAHQCGSEPSYFRPAGSLGDRRDESRGFVLLGQEQGGKQRHHHEGRREARRAPFPRPQELQHFLEADLLPTEGYAGPDVQDHTHPASAAAAMIRLSDRLRRAPRRQNSATRTLRCQLLCARNRLIHFFTMAWPGAAAAQIEAIAVS